MGKKCSKCGEYKDLSLFNRMAAAADGHRSECKACKAKLHKLNEANRERMKLNTRRWSAAQRQKSFDELVHGRASTYTVAKCKCKDCSLAFANSLERQVSNIRKKFSE